MCTVARDGSRIAEIIKHGERFFFVSIWIGAIYEAKRRIRDGVLTWRRVGSFGPTRSGRKPSAAFLDELRETAPHPWIDEVRNGKVVEVA